MLVDLETSHIVDEIADKIILMMRPEVYGLRDCNGNEQRGLADLIIFSDDMTYNDIFLNFDEKKKVFDENITNRNYYYL